MIHNNHKNQVTISAVQPDLNFPEIKKGKYKNYSTEVELTITLQGKWNVPTTNFITNSTYKGNSTVVSINCINGLPRVFKMSK